MNYKPSKEVLRYVLEAQREFGQSSKTATINFLLMEHSKYVTLKKCIK